MRHAVLALSLLACNAEEDPANLPSDEVAPPFALFMDPLVPGQPVDITVRGATPGDTVDVVRTNGGFGTGLCPPFLNGLCMDILPGSSNYLLTMSAVADGAGEANWNIPSFPNIPQSDWWFQAVVRSGDVGTSNSVFRAVQPGCGADIYEPNNSVADNVVLTAGSYTDLTSCSTLDEDWYIVMVPPGKRLDASAMFDHIGDGDLDVGLWLDPSGPAVSSNGSGDVESVQWTNTTTQPVPVALQLILYADTGGPGLTYDLDIDLVTVAVCTEDFFEPDDTIPTSSPTGPGQFSGLTLCSTGDNDYFEIDLLSGQTLNVDVLFSHAEGDIDLYLRSVSGTTLAPITSNTDNESLTWIAGNNQTVYLRVTLFQDRGSSIVGNVYDMNITIQ